MSAPTVQEVRDFLAEVYPQSSARVEAVSPRGARVRLPITEAHLRPGGTVSGPVMMAMADWAAYAAVLGGIGLEPHAVTTSLNIDFLRRPASDRAIVAEATTLKLGKRLAVTEIRIWSEGMDEPVAHATATYSIPPARQASR